MSGPPLRNSRTTFLYVALAKLLDLEREVSRYAANNGLPAMASFVHPRQMHGLEINTYAAELASVVIWIGYLEWLADNGLLGFRQGSILESLGNIRLQDALIDRSDPEHPKEAEWPDADIIIGNPPFLGPKQLRGQLGADYTRDLYAVYGDRIPGMSDLVCYFFEKARHQIELRHARRAGLLATNSIRRGSAKRVLERIKDTGDIFLAKKRTLTNLYNQQPSWLANAHAKLDRAVWAAYGWDDPDPAAVDEDTILARLLALNLERADA